MRKQGRSGYRGGFLRSDMNMFVLLSDQDGGGKSDESDSSDSECYSVVMSFRK